MRADGFAVDELVRSRDRCADGSGRRRGQRAAAKFAQGSPVATVTLTGDRGAQMLELRKNKDDYYAKSTPSSGITKSTRASAWRSDKSLDDFRNKKLFDLAMKNLARSNCARRKVLVFYAQRQRLVVERQEDGWRCG